MDWVKTSSGVRSLVGWDNEQALRYYPLRSTEHSTLTQHSSLPNASDCRPGELRLGLIT